MARAVRACDGRADPDRYNSVMRRAGHNPRLQRTSSPCHAGLALLAAATALGGCAPLDVEPARDVLDTNTGTTVVRLAQPMELVAAVPRARTADPFAYLATFATNRMGARRLFLWLAAPGDEAIVATPQLLCDGQAIALQRLSIEPASLGLSQPPYPRPAPWSVEYYYPLDDRTLAILVGARTMTVVVAYAQSGATRFEGRIDTAALQAFADQAGVR